MATYGSLQVAFHSFLRKRTEAPAIIICPVGSIWPVLVAYGHFLDESSLQKTHIIESGRVHDFLALDAEWRDEHRRQKLNLSKEMDL